MRRLDVVEAKITSEGRAVWLRWNDGLSETLPAIWFCDNADQAFDPLTGQRRQSLSDLNLDVVLQSVTLDTDALSFRSHPVGEARISRARLRLRRRRPEPPSRWLTPDAFSGLAPISAEAFLNRDDALQESLTRLAQLGVAMLSGAPICPGVVGTLVARFGFIRQTNYGRLFDVRAEPVPSNLAYTAQGLDLHTDNPYREPVPSLQLLHAIKCDEQGGETYFVDGLAHAEAMAKEDPQAFARLAGEAVAFQYTTPDGAAYRTHRPIIALGLDGAPQAIHLNHRSLAPVTMAADKVADWYAAYRDFHRRVHQPAARLGAHLRPGDVVLFDNRRVLHGRAAFHAAPDGAGRWLQGCYADVDGALATLARLSGACP